MADSGRDGEAGAEFDGVTGWDDDRDAGAEGDGVTGWDDDGDGGVVGGGGGVRASAKGAPIASAATAGGAALTGR
jgi:hypothetical protein